MSGTEPWDEDVQRALDLLQADQEAEPAGLAARVVGWPGQARGRLIDAVLPSARGRRWLRGALLPALPPDEAAALATRLLAWREDFAPDRRDRTTPEVVRRLPLDTLQAAASLLAGGNTAGALWQRLARDAPGALFATARRVLTEGDRVARETTLHTLLLDPYGPARLPEPEQLRLLDTALADVDDEIRGLAAELSLERDPARLVTGRDDWVRDPSERARMAAWEAAFLVDPERAAEHAIALVSDDAAPLPARRSALLAAGGTLPTARVAPLLAAVVLHPERALAEDGANLLWAYHRTPSVAAAAARSPHPAVREIGQRLLHPETGSPAAGGSRSGAPEPPDDIYRLMLRQLEERGRSDREPGAGA